jgi:hypothetical protein
MKKVTILLAVIAITASAMAQLKLTNSGNVGIGTNSPLVNLQLGDIWTFYDGPNNKIIGRNTYWNGSNYVRIQKDVASRIVFDYNGAIQWQTAVSGNAGSPISSWNTVTMLNNGDVGIGTSPTQKLHVVGNSYFNGNVGINISSPTYKLDVKGTARFAILGQGWDEIRIAALGDCIPSAKCYNNQYLDVLSSFSRGW